MMLAMAFCHRDVEQALRVIRWIGFLSSQDGGWASKVPALLVANRIASLSPRFQSIVTAASSTFHSVDLRVPVAEEESGWPMSPNFMFRETLFHVEQHQREDVFWLEPDAIPITTDFYPRIQAEYDLGGQPFMGAFVRQGDAPHMTGVGVYGHNWRRFAPSIAKARGVPWDVFAGPDILAHCHRTELIQHRFRGPPVSSTAILNPKAVVYHQDKNGRLIRLLDDERFGGQCHQGKKDLVEEIPTMIKCYHTVNATLPLRIAGFRIKFEPYDVVGGTQVGVLATEDQAVQTAMASVTDRPGSGVTEITPEEYNAHSKKKLDTRNALRRSVAFDLGQSIPGSDRVPVRGATTNPSASPSPPVPPPKETVKLSLEEVLRTSTITPSQPPPTNIALPRPPKAPRSAAARNRPPRKK